ncbi:MAG TPA: XrtA system polysaccharide chain length determinant [Rhodanobacteraceae bacterium]
MAQAQAFDLHDLYQHVLLELHAAWRYRWHALVVAWGVVIVGALLVFGMPNKYEAKAQVYADTEALMNPLLRGLAVQPDVRGRLDIITHTLLARPNLETVADQTGLSLRATTPADKDALLQKLGAEVKIKDAGATNLYNISYADPDPKMAQKVVQAFLQILMNDTLGADVFATKSAQTFLQQQVHDYGAKLNAEDQKIADFKKANIGYFMGGAGGQGSNYYARLQAAQADLQNLQNQYAAAASGHVVVSAGDPKLQALDKQIKAYEDQLNTLLLNYTNAYPGVISARRAIADLKARRAKLESGGGSEGSTHTVSNDGAKRAIAARIAAQQQVIAGLKASVDKSTDVQAQLQQLTRNYEITKKQYDELVARMNTAQLSQDATQTGNNLKFRVISPPIVPLIPVSPKRGLLLAIVLVLALGVGGAFAYFLHKIKPVFVSLKSLRQFVEFPVIGSLGLIESAALHQRRHRELLGFFAGVGALVLVVAIGFAFDGHLAHLVQHVYVMGAT